MIDLSNNIMHMSYTVSQHDLVQTWLDMMHPGENIVVMHDPGKHVEMLTKMGFVLPEEEMWESKIMVIQVSAIDEVLWIIKNVKHDVGPYCQAWINGRYITDNIDC